MRLGGAPGGGGAIVGAGDGADDDFDLVAFGPERGGGGFEARPIDIEQHQARAIGGEGFGDGLANALGGAGNEYALHFIPPVFFGTYQHWPGGTEAGNARDASSESRRRQAVE